VALALLFVSCSSILPPDHGTLLAPERAPMRYSIVCIIHGDGDYVYHDSSGDEHLADEEALVKAETVAVRNPQAEVFIFHEIPRTHYLLFFPRHDGEFYYYRGGHLITKELYWRDAGNARFDPEVEFYNRFHVEESFRTVRLFLYFGHEIPEFVGDSYDRSYPGWTFTVNDLTDGLKRITRDTAKFDLVVLSTCFNGTPHTIEALSPYARYIVASPDNLHLSYFDTSPLEHLETDLQDGDMSTFSKKFAHNAFDQLVKTVQTAITVAAYDVARTEPFLHYVNRYYDHTLAALAIADSATLGNNEHCDCTEDPAYVVKGIDDGVELFYRAAHFGRSKNVQRHSGWECWKEKMWHIEDTQALQLRLK
jgi:hypothetical protein